MESLSQQLQSLHGRIGLMCVGNPDGGDDAFGVRLGEELVSHGLADVVIAGTNPESFLARGEHRKYDHLIFIDVVDFGGAPGSVVFLDSSEMTSRFPQVSTHRLSLGLLATLSESNGVTKAWLLGVQPESLEHRRQLSPGMRVTMATLEDMLLRRLSVGVSTC